MRKHRPVIQEEYKVTAQHHRDGTKKARICLMWDVKGNKKGLSKYVSRKKESQAKHGPVHKWGRDPADKVHKKG